MKSFKEFLRESDLILEHPDWFYWVYTDTFHEYYPPYVPGLGSTLSPKPEYLPYVYSSQAVWNHIHKFSYAPNIIDPEKWERVVEEYRQTPGASILDLVSREFGLTVAPAFSDHINDVQPPWTDVTFFRMYMDHPVESQKYLGGQELPPYILFDTIKSNLYKGNIINEGLWATLSNIIPFYQQNYGIDGARIDMGHALPSELIHRIIANARTNDPDFCFIAEELQDENAKVSRDNGYNMIIGYGFFQEPRTYEHRTHKFMYDSRHLPCPVFAGGETHDTPRLAAREGGRTLSKMLTVMNMFMPNGVPFINSGQEVYEIQPMNTGLDCRNYEQYVLPHNDRYFGKLALFDKFAIHYLNHMRWELPDTLEIIVYLFIFSSEILGEIQNFYGIFPHWDTMLHTLNGFLCAAIGFSLVDILNTTNSRITMTPSFVALVAFSFSMTVGVMREFGEFAMDRYFYKDMQKDTIVNRISSVKINRSGENIPITLKDINKTEIYSDSGKTITIIDNGYLDIGLIDTMKDLFVNFIGAVVFCILGYLYIKNRDGYKFLEGFISKKKSKVE